MSTKFKTLLLYITIFLNGAIVLVVEILGTRVVGPFFGSTIFVWSSLLAVALGFLSLGYWIGGMIADKKTSPSIFYSIILTGGLLTSLVMKVDQPVLIFTEQFGIQFGPLWAATILFALPLTLFGMVSPFAIRLQTDELSEVGGTSGRIFAIATIGSLVGALASGFYLIPNFPISKIFIWSGVTLAFVAATGFIISSGRWSRGTAVTSLLFILGSYTAIAGSPIKWEDTTYTMQVIHTEPSFRAETKVVEAGERRCLVLDGGAQSCIFITESKDGKNAYPYIDEMGSAIKRLDEVDNALVLGAGTGPILQIFSEETEVDAVDIDPKTFELGKRFFGLTEKPNVNLIVADARSFLRSTDKKYDVIISDIATNVTLPSHLATLEYFSQWKEHLNDDGLVVLNLVSSANPNDLYTTSVIKTLREVFPYTKMKSISPNTISSGLVFASTQVEPDIVASERYQIVYPDVTNGTILTDDYVPIEHLSKLHSIDYRQRSRNFGGPRLFFVN